VLSSDNRVPPCPDRGRTVGGLEGTSVAVGMAVGVCDGATVGVSGGTSAAGPDGATVGLAAEIVAAGVRVATALVGVAFSGSPPDGVAAPGPEGSGVALGRGPVPGFATGGFSDARAGIGATVSSCGVDVAAGVDVAVSCAVGMGVGRPAAMVGGCATGAGTVVGAGGAATIIACPVAKDGFPRLGVAARLGVASGDTATPPVVVASAMAVGGPLCGPRPAALISQLTTVGEPAGETSPRDTLLGPTNRTPVVAWRSAHGGGGVGVLCATVGRTTSGRCA
jgi:hypothetical protein